VVLATKVGNPVRDEHELVREFSPNERGASRAYLLRAVDGCLRRLGTDRIDLLYHHGPDTFSDGSWVVPLEETWGAFEEIVRQGKVLYLGVSNRTRGQFEQEMRAIGVASGILARRIVAVQNLYNLVDRDRVSGDRSPESAFLAHVRSAGVGLVPLMPLALGLLAGRYRRDAIDPTGRLASSDDRKQAERYLMERNFILVDALEAMSRRAGCTMAHLAIAWLLSHEEVPSVIAGITRYNQMEENARAAAVTLSVEDLAELDRLTDNDIRATR
jgi:1-deoxyxylulose-5-phosphate synthase